MLTRILEEKRGEVRELQRTYAVEESSDYMIRPLAAALTAKKPELAVIAEIKRASPTKGVLSRNWDPLSLARVYSANGASAISVLTDQCFFRGDPSYLQLIKPKVELPLLRKDFIIDGIQVYQSRGLGADAVLLIAAILDYPRLLHLVELTLGLGMEPLVEVHNRQELTAALDTPTRVIGVNNRNLQDFAVSLDTSLELAGLIPDHITKISESGIKNRADVELLREVSYDAVLVGEALVTAGNAAEKLCELAGQVDTR
jgi:indole-3-glycerol phosphate synthase